jgi:hypothetical protein
MERYVIRSVVTRDHAIGREEVNNDARKTSNVSLLPFFKYTNSHRKLLYIIVHNIRLQLLE